MQIDIKKVIFKLNYDVTVYLNAKKKEIFLSMNITFVNYAKLFTKTIPIYIFKNII